MTIIKDEKGRIFCDECNAYMRPHGFGCTHLYPPSGGPSGKGQPPPEPEPEPEPKPLPKPPPIPPRPVRVSPNERMATALENIEAKLDEILLAIRGGGGF